VIAAAALCPAAPLMAAELTGDDPDAAAVRAAAADAVARIVRSGAGAVAVVTAGPVTREWPATGHADLAPYGGPRLPGGVPRVPLGLGLGGRLLDAAGFSGDRLLWTVGPADPPPLDGAAALLVMADGSAHRNLKTSTDLAARAERFDALVEKSIVDGDLTPLLAVDPALAEDLMVPGFPALRLLAAELPRAASVELLYCAAPFGVGYFVATLHI
jgi:hypothetical protein